MNFWITLMLAVTVAAMGLLSRPGVTPMPGFPGWPATWDGVALEVVEPTAADRAATVVFPGRIARFRVGDHHLVLRWVAGPTRTVHAAADCLRADGWSVTPLPPRRESTGWWTCCRAERDGRRITVREQIRAVADGRSWADSSAWWWQADDLPGGYWVVTLEEAEP